MFWGDVLGWGRAGMCERGTSEDSVAIIGDSRVRSFVSHIEKIFYNQKRQPTKLANVLVSSWASVGYKHLVHRAEHYLMLGAGRNILVFCGGINDVVGLFSAKVVPDPDEWKEAVAWKLRPLKEFFAKHRSKFITPMIVEVFGIGKKYRRLTDDAKHSVNQFLEDYNNALRDICHDNDGIFVKTSQLNLDQSNDGIHVNYRNNFIMDGLVATSAPIRLKSDPKSNPQT